MKRIKLAGLMMLLLLVASAPIIAQSIVFPAASASGTIGGVAVNTTLQPGTYGPAVCYPAPGLPVSYPVNVPDCSPNLGLGFGPAPATQTFTTITASVSTPVPASEAVEFVLESAATSGSLGFCQISAGSTSCSNTLTSGSVTQGDLLSVAVRLSGSTAFTPPSVTWSIQ